MKNKKIAAIIALCLLLAPAAWYKHSSLLDSLGGTAESAASTSTKSSTSKMSFPKKQPDGTLQAYFLDIGQGDATYIHTPQGDDILIDAGKNGKGDDVVAYLRQLGVKDIEVMIATHPDADHIGGLDEVLEAMPVKAVYAPKVAHTTGTYKDFLLAVKNAKLTIKTAKAGVKLDLPGVAAEFAAPVKEYGDDLNDWSAVLRISYGKTAFLFTGDAEAKSEKDMIDSKAELSADVLKVGHHGANTSTSDAFLKKVQPKFAVISVGKNSYGHPTAETLAKLAKQKAKIYRTDKNGTVTAVSNGKTVTLYTVR